MALVSSFHAPGSRRLAAIGLCLALVLALPAPDAARADCEAQPAPAKWCGGGTIPWGYGQGLTGVLTGARLTIKLEIELAISDMNFVFSDAGVPLFLSGPGASAGGIEFTYGKTSLGASSCSSTGNYAKTYTTFNISPGSPIASLTGANVDFNNQFSGWTGQLALTVAYHEIGHALGIDHVYNVPPGSCSAGATAPLMFPQLACSDAPGLDALFEKAIRCLYGPGGTALQGVTFGYRSGGRARTSRSSCAGTSGCTAAVALAALATLRYDLSISDAGGPYVPFASLAETDWVDNSFDYIFPEAHSSARVKMEVWDGATLMASPISDAIDIPAPVSVDEHGPGGVVSLAAGPNPFHDRTRITLDLDRGRSARVWIADLAGRRVHTVSEGPLGAGRHEFSWDGTDDRGRTAPSGVYFLRANAGDAFLARSILKLR